MHRITTLYETDRHGRKVLRRDHADTLRHLTRIATLLEVVTRPTRLVCLGCGCLCLSTESCPGCRARREQRSHQ